MSAHHTPADGALDATALMGGHAYRLPARIVAAIAAATGAGAAVYVMDVDGSRLHLLAGEGGRFPAEIAAPLGIGPEIPAEALAPLEAAVAAAVAGARVAPLMLRDRALGVLVGLGSDRERVAEAAEEAAVAVETVSGYTDVVHDARRRRYTHPASEVQQSLLPPRIARVAGGALAGGVLPGYRIGGDFFDYADNEEGLWLAVGDGVGKEDEAAALSALAIGALRACRRSGRTLEEAAASMDEVVRRAQGDRLTFLTAILAIWRREDGRLRWITCGHPRPIVRRADGSLETLTDGATRPLGLWAAERPRAAETTLGPGDRLVLYSDGIVEHIDARTGRALGVEAVLAAIAAGAGASAAAMVRRLQDLVLATGEDLRDDATLLVLDAGS